MRTIKFSFAILSAIILIGCVNAPQKPETIRQSIAYGYATIDSLADALRISKRDGHITAEKRDEVADQLQTALNDLNEAESIVRAVEQVGSVDPSLEDAAERRILKAQAILGVVESILSETEE